MAKKQKGGRTSSKLASIGQANFRTEKSNGGESPIDLARRFGPFNWMVNKDHRLGEWVAEVDKKGVIRNQDHAVLVEKAEAVLGGNICSPERAGKSPDIRWAEASWAHPEGVAKLDPHRKFLVGVRQSPHPKSVEECMAKARFLSLEKSQLPEGLTMLPNEEGNHLQVTLLGILLNRGLLEVYRDGELVGKATIWDGLCGFTEQQREFFSRPTKGEERRKAAEDKKATELRREKRAAARAERKAKEAREKEAAELEALAGLFDQVVERAEEEALEAELAEKRAQWAEFVENASELKKAWAETTEMVAKAYGDQEERIAAYCALFRPAAPTSSLSEAGVRVYKDLIATNPDTAKGQWAALGAWAVQTHKERREGTLEESLGRVHRNFPNLLGDWFRETSEGVVPWGPLGPIQLYSRDAWVGVAGWHPGIGESQKHRLLELGGEE